jgi:septum formation protein
LKSQFVLKSSSPRRKEILLNLGFSLQILPSNFNEEEIIGEKPLDYLKRVTLSKLGISETQDLYVSSDTIVVFEEQILHKPQDKVEAISILKLLNGKEHFVYSGLGLSRNGLIFFEFDQTIVEFKKLSVLEMETYIEICKPFDKAGGYGIQDNPTPVKGYKGSYSNVIGFPLRKFYSQNQIWRDFLDFKV